MVSEEKTKDFIERYNDCPKAKLCLEEGYKNKEFFVDVEGMVNMSSYIVLKFTPIIMDKNNYNDTSRQFTIQD